MENKIEFRKIRDFGEVISDTFVFIKQNFKPLIKVFLILCGVFILANMILAITQQMSLTANMGNGRMSIAKLYRGIGFNHLLRYYVLMMIFLFLHYTAVYVSILSFIALYIQKGNQAPSIDEVWSYFKFYFFRIFGSLLGVTVFLVVCFMCCIFPGIYVFPAVTLFYPIMILENGSFWYSFGRGFKLVKNEWWITAATLIIIWIITYIFLTIVQLPSILLMMINMFTHKGQELSKGYIIISSVFQQIAQIFMIIPVICSAFIYFNLVERKENTGLIDRIDTLGTNTSSHQAELEEY